MKLAELFSNFINTDIRKKLIKFSNITKINFYPTYFCEKGIKSLYSNIILNILLLGKSSLIKKFIYDEIINFSNYKQNVLISLPRSGSMATRLMLNSYFELLFKVGEGVPQYDNVNHKWIFKIPNIFSAELYNNLNIRNTSFNYIKYLNKKDYDLHKVFFTRFPLSRIDILKLEHSNPVLIIREPKDQILSYYTNHYSKDRKDLIMKKAYENYLSFTEFWQNYFKNKKHRENFLIIKFNNIKENPKEVLKEILNFYKIEIIETYLDISASIHTQKNTSERLKNIKLQKNRFTDVNAKKNFEDEVNLKLEILDKDKLLQKNYNKLIDLKK